MKLLTFLFLLLSGCILTHSRLSLIYAGMGLELWLGKMVPALLPFMILSGIMVRMKLTDRAAMLIYPVVGPIYNIRKNVCYALLTGFLCGFPMGARVTADLYERQMISKREAEYLLAFCNNIGPVYFCSFVLPLLGRKLVFPYLFGMYGIPLLYGLILRLTVFRDLPASHGNSPAALVSCEQPFASYEKSKRLFRWQFPRRIFPVGKLFLQETDNAIRSSIQGILSLGGYMILYNLLNLIPHILLGHPLTYFSPLLEITGGLTALGDSLPLYSLLCLSFGGLSCIAQTYSCIGETDLSVGSYVRHKLILTALTGVYYLCWSQILPASFLR